MRIETQRLIITEFTSDMAEAVHLHSLDDDTRRFLPDEVFETVEAAAETIDFLIGIYQTGDGPLVYPILLKDGTYVGYVQAVPLDDGSYEIGYHIGHSFTKQGYATEVVRAFLPAILPKLGLSRIFGICHAENTASLKVLERCGFSKVFDGIDLYHGKEEHICKFVYLHS